MSTRSFIAMKTKHGYKAIYCHWDGYFNGVGTTLANYYTNPEKVEALMALGAISALGRDVAPQLGQVHTFKNPADGVTIAYGRDRGDEDTEAGIYPSYKAMIANAYDCCIEYVYIFNGKGWKGCHLQDYKHKADRLTDFEPMTPKVPKTLA